VVQHLSFELESTHERRKRIKGEKDPIRSKNKRDQGSGSLTDNGGGGAGKLDGGHTLEKKISSSMSRREHHMCNVLSRGV